MPLYTKNHKFTSFDGASICYRQWNHSFETDLSKKPNKAIVLLHRGHEHSARLDHIVKDLGYGQNDHTFFAWDARGHGQSTGMQTSDLVVSTLVKDLNLFIDHISKEHSIAKKDIVIIAQSVAAIYTATWLHDYAPQIKGVVLASPAFDINLYVPFAVPILSATKCLFNKPAFVRSYVKGRLLTHDKQRARSYDTDELVVKPIATSLLLDVYKTSHRIVKDSAAITTPVLLLVSGDDLVVKKQPQYEFFTKLGSTLKEVYELPGFYHDTLGEEHRDLAFRHIRNFLMKLDSISPSALDVDLTNASSDKYHFSTVEANKLASNPGLLKKLLFSAQKAALGFGASFSDALNIGKQAGFDSGSMLDYVYENKPTSKTKPGQWVDSLYLNAIGWKGIRVRQKNLMDQIYESLESVYSSKQETTKDEPVHIKIVDIAAGHGRYVLQAADLFKQKYKEVDLELLLSDYSELNVEKGSKLISDMHMDNAHFEKGDAFDSEYLTKIAKNADIVIVSGFYELYSDNDLIRKSLKAVTSAMNKGGFLIYTNQPWHPQLEFIARVLTSHRNGQAWVMRRRSQQEMDQLVLRSNESCKLSKVDSCSKIDDYGIFTVSCAQKE